MRPLSSGGLCDDALGAHGDTSGSPCASCTTHTTAQPGSTRQHRLGWVAMDRCRQIVVYVPDGGQQLILPARSHRYVRAIACSSLDVAVFSIPRAFITGHTWLHPTGLHRKEVLGPSPCLRLCCSSRRTAAVTHCTARHAVQTAVTEQVWVKASAP